MIPPEDDNSQSSDFYDLGPSVLRLDGDPDQNDKDDDIGGTHKTKRK
jgi:hypothetical protein